MPPEPRRNSVIHPTHTAPGSDTEAPPAGGNLFLWAIALLLLVGFALGCWIFSFYVFGHPEKDFSYSILSKLKKLDPPKRFELTAAPRGEFLTAKQLTERFAAMNNRELERASEAFLRNYLRNYKLTQDLVPYVVGSFNILDSHELSGGNVFPSGVVALAQASDHPGVLIEHVFTADAKVVHSLQRMLLTGLDLRLDKGLDLSAIVNVSRLADGRLQFTAVPILYGSYASSTGPGTFSLSPPESLNLAAGLPVLDAKAIAQAGEKYDGYRKRAGLTPASDAPRRSGNQLVRVERPRPAPGGTPVPTATPQAATAVPEQAVTGEAGVTETRPGAEPFATQPESIATTAAGNWSTYTPGQMPRGRLMKIADMGDLAGRGVAGERIYLQGSFVVTAAGQSRAVLRSNTAATETLGIGGSTSQTRVIVEFPAGSTPPEEGASFSRDSRRPFLITGIRRGADGQVNVYVREITRP